MAIAPDQDLGFNGSSTTTVTVSGTFPAGALICAVVGFATAASGQSISQSGNSFTTLFTRENSATNNLVYYSGYITNWAGGALSTTFTLSGTGKDAGARLLSFTGVKTVGPLITSKDAGGAPSSVTFDSTAASGIALPGSLVVGFYTFANTADISGTQSQGGSPVYGWTQTARSAGTSGNTPHGHAFFTWNILGSSPVPAPQATQTHTGSVSYGAQVAVFQEDFQPFVDAAPAVLQFAEWGATTGTTTNSLTLTDSLTVDDSASTLRGLLTPAADVLTVTETLIQVGSTYPDTGLVVSETLPQVGSTYTDTALVVDDSASTLQGQAAPPADQLTVSDSASTNLGATTFTDQLTVAETLAQVGSTYPDTGLAVNEALTVIGMITLTDQLAVSETFSLLGQATLTDTLAIIETITPLTQPSITLTDSLTPTETDTLLGLSTLTDTLTVADSGSQLQGQAQLTDALTVTEVLTLQSLLTFTDQLTVTETTQNLGALTTTDQLTLSEALTLLGQVAGTDVLTVTETGNLLSQLAATDILSVTESGTEAPFSGSAYTATDQMTITESLLLMSRLTLTDVLTLSEQAVPLSYAVIPLLLRLRSGQQAPRSRSANPKITSRDGKPLRLRGH